MITLIKEACIALKNLIFPPSFEDDIIAIADYLDIKLFPSEIEDISLSLELDDDLWSFVDHRIMEHIKEAKDYEQTT